MRVRSGCLVSRRALEISSVSFSPLTQTRARIHPQIHTATDRVPLGRDRDRLADDVQVAPALGEPALALKRGAAAGPVHQIHRLPRAVAGVDRCKTAAGALL